jgi:pyridoxal phosphate-dependent aminotransferase EpsN
VVEMTMADNKPVAERIFLSSPHLSGLEMGYIEEAFAQNWVAPLGPNVDGLEAELAERCRVGHCAALSSGTAALHLALVIAGVQAGDVVLCQSLNFIAGVNPVQYVGAEPVLVDSEAASANMSPEALAAALAGVRRSGRRIGAVVVADLYGRPARWDELERVLEGTGIPVIEDAAEALGAKVGGKMCGSFGKMGILSFNGNKIITTSGGGALLAESEEAVQRARFLATQARDGAPWYEHSQVGFNYRMSNIAAGIGRGQLEVLEERCEARRRVFERYRQELGGLSGVSFAQEPAGEYWTRWLTVMHLAPEAAKAGPAEVIAALGKENIEARHVWKPMHLQPLFAGRDFYRSDGSCVKATSVTGWDFVPEKGDVAAQLFKTGVCLPSGSNLTEAEQARVIGGVKELLGR